MCVCCWTPNWLYMSCFHGYCLVPWTWMHYSYMDFSCVFADNMIACMDWWTASIPYDKAKLHYYIFALSLCLSLSLSLSLLSLSLCSLSLSLSLFIPVLYAGSDGQYGVHDGRHLGRQSRSWDERGHQTRTEHHCCTIREEQRVPRHLGRHAEKSEPLPN